jgi:hypothetical protein
MTKKHILVFMTILVVPASIATWYFQDEFFAPWFGKAKYLGRSTNNWRVELRNWEPAYPGQSVDGWARRAPFSEHWLSKLSARSAPPINVFDVPLLSGDPMAIPVLVELLRAPERKVRLIAIHGLQLIGSRALAAVPELLKLEEAEDWEERRAARAAVGQIDLRIWEGRHYWDNIQWELEQRNE